jgi:formylglycine-generating enzyme
VRLARPVFVAPILVLSAGACSSGAKTAPPVAQVVLHVDTDAPVVHDSSDAAPGWTDPIPLFDRLHVDLYPPGASTPCSDCSNEFSVSFEDFTAGNVSLGLVPNPGDTGWVARVELTVELFELSTGDIDPDTTIDAWVTLPTVNAGQVTDVTIVLSTSATGQPSGSLQAPVDPAAGPPSASEVGTWPSAQRVTCSTNVPSGAVCVPGGAYWMGASSATALVPGASRTWRRLVVLSPFWLDSTEATAGQVRPLNLPSSELGRWSGSTAGTSSTDFCTYAATPNSKLDVLPVNCIAWSGASSVCTGRGGALPTEAQIEYVAGGAFGQPYPWGQDPPACADAIWGRDGYGVYANSLPQSCLAPSNYLAPLGGPEPPGEGARDTLALPGGNVVDLSGNLYEMAEDSYQLSGDPCWAPQGILKDPLCAQPSPEVPGAHTLRAGAWTVGGSYLEAGHRLEFDAESASPDTGFRCAWKGQ